MRLLVQRVKKASVSVNKENISSINNGILIFIGFSKNFNRDKVKKAINKILNFRFWPSQIKGFDLNIDEVSGEILVVSQFTLFAENMKGRKPKFNDALDYDLALEEYNFFVEELKKNSNVPVKTGKFGASMEVSLVNNGPVTLIFDF